MLALARVASRGRSVLAARAGVAAPAQRTLCDAAGGDIINADRGMKSFQLYHKSHIALTVLAPAAIVLSNITAVSTAIDLALGIIIPAHTHIGMNWIISDYAKKTPVPESTWRMLMVGLTLTATLGFLKMNVMGDGITGTVGALWRDAPEEKKTE